MGLYEDMGHCRAGGELYGVGGGSMGQVGALWDAMGQVGALWGAMGQVGALWGQWGLYGVPWHRLGFMGRVGALWGAMGQVGAVWGGGGLNGAGCDPLFAPPFCPPGSLFVGEVNPKWRRPPLPPEPPRELCFLQLDLDHYVGEGLPHSGACCPIAVVSAP